jgi:hypothetical protein
VIKRLNHALQEIAMVSFVSQSKGQGLVKNLFVGHHPFLMVFLH